MLGWQLERTAVEAPPADSHWYWCLEQLSSRWLGLSGLLELAQSGWPLLVLLLVLVELELMGWVRKVQFLKNFFAAPTS